MKEKLSYIYRQCEDLTLEELERLNFELVNLTNAKEDQEELDEAIKKINK